ncbi:MAG: DNA repair protein RecO [Bacteroidales bacterium]|nr:DNA repair protein RecO [Bacteroidales bacterium]
MIERVVGIVLKSVPYKESSNIVSVYTRELGLRSFIIKGGRGKKAPTKSSLFQPLQILNIETYIGKSELLQVKEANLFCNINNIHTDIVKSSLAFFIIEVILLSLKGEQADVRTYSFFYDTVLALNEKENKELKDFHLFFLYDFAKLLGFEPPDLSPHTSNKKERNDRLSLFLDFYHQHITNQREIKSQEILRLIL